MRNETETDSLGVYKNPEPLFIENIEIHKRVMELCIPFEASYGRFSFLEKFFPEITFRTDSGQIIRGIGECSPLSAPWYNYECSRTTEAVMQYIIASLTGKNADEADGIAAVDNLPVTDVVSFIERYKWIAGHNIAKCGFEGAYWDAVARLNNVPVFRLWGGTRDKVAGGTSVGMESATNKLLEKIDIAAGRLKVPRIKIKISPGKDIKYIEAVRNSYPDILLQVDANASYDLFNEEHIARLKEMDNYNLLMIEQPGRNDDVIDHARQLALLDTPVCLDESILHFDHARQAIDLWRQYSETGKLIINIKPSRVGGYYEAIKIADLCGRSGVAAWCGGMYESALGKTANIHFSSRAEINLPGDHISQAPYFIEDVAEFPEYSDGMLTVPKSAGWGLGTLKIY